MRTVTISKIKQRESTPQEQAAIARISRCIETTGVEEDFEGDFMPSLSFHPQCPRLERTLQEYKLIHSENDHA